MDLATAAQYRSSFLLSTAAYEPGSPPPLPPQLTSTTSSSSEPPPAILGGKSLSFSYLVLHEGERMGAGSNLSNGALGGGRRGAAFIPAVALMERPVASGDTVGICRKHPCFLFLVLLVHKLCKWVKQDI